MLPDLPADFCRFVDVYEARSKDSKTVNGIDELKVEVGKLKAEINNLKKGISSTEADHESKWTADFRLRTHRQKKTDNWCISTHHYHNCIAK